jgi:hypothetical protein
VREEDQVKLVPTSEIQMLGVPLDNDAFTSAFVEKKLFSRLNTTVGQLVEFEDTQSALFLLRVSYSIVRAVHFMRTTPLRQWQKQGEKFDHLVRDAAEKILAFPMTDETYSQASLTPTLGGLGLRRTVEHAGPPSAPVGTSPKKQPQKIGTDLLRSTRSIRLRRKPPSTSTYRCCSTWSALLQTSASVRGSSELPNHTRVVSSLEFPPKRRTGTTPSFAPATSV